MIDLLPKLSDMSALKAASAMLALPMLCVAYVLQDGAQIGWDGNVWLGIDDTLSETHQLRRLFLIFVLKSLWAVALGAVAYGVFGMIYVATSFPVLPLLSVILLALGIFGIFGKTTFPQLDQVNQFWFYAFLVWSLFLSGMHEQLESRT